MAELITRGITPKYANPDVRDSIKVVNQRCIRDGVINFALARVHDLSYRKVSESKILKPGDTLVNSTGVGTLGRTAYFSSGVGDFTADSHVTIVRPRLGVEPRWLAYALKLLEPDIEFLAEGSTGQTELSRDRLGQLPVDAPPKLTQRAIAATLGALDDKIESNNHLISLLNVFLESQFDKACQENETVYLSFDDAVKRLQVKHKHSGKTVFEAGRTPVFDQSVSGVLGYVDTAPEFVASVIAPVALFGDHTCTWRLLKKPQISDLT